MSNRPFFPLLGGSQRRREAVRRNSDRETQRRAPVATTSNVERNGSSSSIATQHQTQASTPTPTSSDSAPDGINLAIPALGNSDDWRSCQMTSGLGSRGLTDVTEQAATLFARLAEAENYLDSAESTWGELCMAREQLQTLLDRVASPDEQLLFKAVRTLGNIYGQLGDFDKAQSTLLSLCPSLPLTRSDFGELIPWHKIDALLYYLRSSTATVRDLDQAEKAARILPWTTPDVLRVENRKLPALLTLIRIWNCKGLHTAAYEDLEIFEVASPPVSLLDPDYLLQKAMATAGIGMQSTAQALYVDAVILSSLVVGAWHRQTLHTLYEFGRALKAWCKYEQAVKVLTNCCQGYYYTFGVSHPLSIRAFKELEVCEGADVAVQKLRHLGHRQYSCKRKWSTAYEQIYLTTSVESLKPVVAIDYDRVSRKLEKLLEKQGLSNRVKFDIHRNLAWCAYEQNKLNAASAALYSLHESVNETSSNIVGLEAYRATLASDEAIVSAKSTGSGTDFMRQRSRLVYLGLKSFPRGRNHQVKAILRRLTRYNLTHFTRDVVFSEPPLVSETNRERLGSGSFAIVDAVMIGERFYARKSISLPRQHQHRLREDIQTEIKIIHALDHPHVVRVLFTYEETRSFSIIMHPLADCDLETYLITKTCVSPREESLIWKWMACLVNTLAFIHSKDIRHKDIKPRNVLIKGEKVYFTDFGSGHIFSDGGNSTTEGLAYGHTRAYCAPEVIKNDTRNRSSDVFSLGCVLMEMAAWSSKISRSNYFLGLGNDEDNADSVQYHSVLNRIKTWFEVNPSLTRRSKELYSEVLKHMLRTKPDLRWSAVKVSCAIGKIVSPPECVKCGIDLWVPGSFVD